MTIAHAVDLYLGELARQGRTPRTLDRYRRILTKLYDQYQAIDVEEVTSPMVRRYLDTFALNKKKPGRVPNSPATTGQIASIARSFFAWLYDEEYIKRNPAERIKRPKLPPAHENDHVLSVSAEDVRVLLRMSNERSWSERIAVYLAVYTGARRHALSQIRRSDYDMVDGTLRFHEKGDKTIVKPVARQLGAVLNAAVASGLYDEQDNPYLIPPLAKQRREGERDDRVVWKLIRRCADKAGVDTHVHALRAAFATFYLEEKPENVIALQNLMGHARLETTLIYLRRLNRKQAMETVRDLDWGVDTGFTTPEFFDAHQPTEKEGFEPSFPVRESSGSEGTL